MTTTTLSKESSILSALRSSSHVHLPTLRTLALTPGGLLNTRLRRLAWHKLCQVPPPSSATVDTGSDRYGLLRYLLSTSPSEDAALSSFISRTGICVSKSTLSQVIRDVPRSLAGDVSRPKLRSRQRQLGNVILNVLESTGSEYYQGLHSFCGLLLLVLSDVGVSSSVASRCATHHFADAGAADFAGVQEALEGVVMKLLSLRDPALFSYLAVKGVRPYFALPWVLTWFSHVVGRAPAARLFDLFLCSHQAMPYYVSVAIVCWGRQGIMEGDGDPGEAHGRVSR